ncbi:MAG TPA: DUF1801 domain-containing protein [Gemmatimonadaceae bacterium]|nr:DUF1801 domain-containing protein [Gemmatimonadaceae bacterium]
MTALDDYVGRQRTEMHALVRELDTIIRAAAPSLEPSLKWGNLTYHHTANVCALVAHARHVNLQVWEAASLPDPAGLLAGTGKAMRHIRFEPGASIDREAVAAIVRAAAEALA